MGRLEGANVLVTGGTGFIGTHLIQRLVAEGCQIRATFHKQEPFLEHDAVQYLRADLTHLDACHTAADGMDFVFMCAANTSGAGVIATTPLVHVTPNVVMNAQMLEASYAARVRKFCFVSSNVVYPPLGDTPAREEDAWSGPPHEVYFTSGWMKRYTEILCQTYAEKIDDPMSVLVVRPSNAYGPYDDFNFKTSHMMAALLRRIADRHQPVEVWGTGKDVKDLIYIEDLIEGIVSAFRVEGNYTTVNVSSGKGYSVQQVVETIARVDGYGDADIRFDRSKPSVIPKRLVSSEKIRTLTGFQAKTSLEDGIRSTLTWYRENKETWVKL
ncbi:MAG: hypothetical protein CME19_18260 [Gemmatimonadetes bacterium]|nr:hypothetical protein [Gemmatimonadota bacterium]|tara:strand:- start:1427 stop:2407 length:981 start_codon:yes stop_codon:yes gene_type:complete